MKFNLVIIFALTHFICGCSVNRKSPKSEFKDGFYTRKNSGKKEVVYVDIADETLRIHPTAIRERRTNS